MTTTSTIKNHLQARNDIATVQGLLDKMKDQMAMALPKHITPERMVRVALTAVQNTPKLLECNRNSLLMAVLRSAQLGLEPDGILGQAYLIPFKRNFKDENGAWQNTMDVQLIVGYKGLIDLARRSGEVSNIIAKEVYANDEFVVDFSQDIPFVHKPKLASDRGEVKFFWAMARFKDGGFHWDYMTKQEVESIRDKGQGKANAVWKDHFIEMGKKTMIRRIAKYLPMSVQKATITEDLIEAGKSFSTNDFGDIVINHDEILDTPDDSPKNKGTEALKEKLGHKKEPVPTPQAEPEVKLEYPELIMPGGVLQFYPTEIPFIEFMNQINEMAPEDVQAFVAVNQATLPEVIKLMRTDDKQSAANQIERMLKGE